MVAHPAAMIGASDAGAHVLSNTDSCYAVWTLQHWVRERKVLTLEHAVRKLTADQADLLGFADRGRRASRPTPPTSCSSIPIASGPPVSDSSPTNRPAVDAS